MMGNLPSTCLDRTVHNTIRNPTEDIWRGFYLGWTVESLQTVETNELTGSDSAQLETQQSDGKLRDLLLHSTPLNNGGGFSTIS